MPPANDATQSAREPSAAVVSSNEKMIALRITGGRSTDSKCVPENRARLPSEVPAQICSAPCSFLLSRTEVTAPLGMPTLASNAVQKFGDRRTMPPPHVPSQSVLTPPGEVVSSTFQMIRIGKPL